MARVGAFEAKTRLSQLLDKVEQGEEITITRHGRAVAQLVPARQTATRREIERLIAGIRAARKGQDCGSRPSTSIRELIEAGRKY